MFSRLETGCQSKSEAFLCSTAILKISALPQEGVALKSLCFDKITWKNKQRRTRSEAATKHKKRSRGEVK